MTGNELIQIADDYQSSHFRQCTRIRNREGTTLDQRMSHLAWLCAEIPNLVSQGKLGKAQRWLGFIQGSLWVLGKATIDEFRQDNRGNLATLYLYPAA